MEDGGTTLLGIAVFGTALVVLAPPFFMFFYRKYRRRRRLRRSGHRNHP